MRPSSSVASLCAVPKSLEDSSMGQMSSHLCHRLRSTKREFKGRLEVGNKESQA
mgnify:CR=1 FL=1